MVDTSTPVPSATSLNEWRVPSARIRDEPATASCSSATDSGRRMREAEYVRVPDQFRVVAMAAVCPPDPSRARAA